MEVDILLIRIKLVTKQPGVAAAERPEILTNSSTLALIFFFGNLKNMKEEEEMGLCGVGLPSVHP